MSGKSFSFPFATLQWLDGSRGKIVFLLVNSIFFFLSLWLGAKRPLARGKKTKGKINKREEKSRGKKRQERQNDETTKISLIGYRVFIVSLFVTIFIYIFCRFVVINASLLAVKLLNSNKKSDRQRQNDKIR